MVGVSYSGNLASRSEARASDLRSHPGLWWNRIKLRLYKGKQSEYSPRTCSLGRPAGGTLCPRPITLHNPVIVFQYSSGTVNQCRMKQQSWGYAQTSPTQSLLRNMSWTKYSIGCLQDLVFTAAQYSSICNVLYVLFSLTNGCRLVPVEALHYVQPLACYILVYYSATFVTLAVAYVLFFILVIPRAPTCTIGGSLLGVESPQKCG